MPIYTNGQVSGYAPRYQRTTTLSPDQQKLLGLETQSKYNMGTTAVEQSAKLREHLNKNQIDPSQWQPWQTDLKTQDLRQDAGATDRAGIEKAMMESYNRSVKPQEERTGSELGSARVFRRARRAMASTRPPATTAGPKPRAKPT